MWLDWLLKNAGPRIYLVVFLTGALGLRCSEALALKREDIKLDNDIPKVRVTGETHGAKKSPGDVYVRKQHIGLLRKHLKDGITVEMIKRHKHGKGELSKSRFAERRRAGRMLRNTIAGGLNIDIHLVALVSLFLVSLFCSFVFGFVLVNTRLSTGRLLKRKAQVGRHTDKVRGADVGLHLPVSEKCESSTLALHGRLLPD